jgi:hypothetical protein
MSTTNAILLTVAGHRVALDLDAETALLPSFQANDRTKPDSIQSDFSPEFSVPATAKNHRLLGHAAASPPAQGRAYKRVPAVLTSGGVETLPLATLLIKGYADGRYNLQLIGGNRRLVEALGDKTLADLDLSRFDHNWTPANILAGLPYTRWQGQGWGYEFYDRGKPVDFQNTDPYTLYPSCSAQLILNQIIADAGFTSTDLTTEPLFAALNVPAANPFTFDQDFINDRSLKAGFEHAGHWYRDDEFQEVAPFNFTARKPFSLGAVAGAAGSTANRFVVPTLGYYDLDVSIATYFGCNRQLFGEVSMKVLLRKNGAPLLNDDGSEVKAEDRFKGYKNVTLAVNKKGVLLQPGDVIDVRVQGDKWPDGQFDPDQPQWYIGTRVVGFGGIPVPPFSGVEPAVSWSVNLQPTFPPGGLVKLNEWLPDMKQLDFVKAMMLVLGLTIQVDPYTPHLRFAPGWQLLANVSKAKDWTMKRDAWAVPGRTPERSLEFRFGSYGQLNKLLWKEDENVTAGYGDGSLAVADEVLPAEYEMATLPFAATENSPQVPGLLRILNFDTDDATAKPVVYTSVKAQPRLTLRPPTPDLAGQLIMQPATDIAAAVLAGFTTTVSYFDSADLSLVLDKTVLTYYWADLRAMLDESRYLTERYRLTAQDIAELSFDTPIWDGLLGDYFAVSVVSEFDARRPTEVKLCRLNAAHLGPPPVPPVVPGGLREWWGKEWYASEWY